MNSYQKGLNGRAADARSDVDDEFLVTSGRGLKKQLPKTRPVMRTRSVAQHGHERGGCPRHTKPREGGGVLVEYAKDCRKRSVGHAVLQKGSGEIDLQRRWWAACRRLGVLGSEPKGDLLVMGGCELVRRLGLVTRPTTAGRRRACPVAGGRGGSREILLEVGTVIPCLYHGRRRPGPAGVVVHCSVGVR